MHEVVKRVGEGILLPLGREDGFGLRLPEGHRARKRVPVACPALSSQGFDRLGIAAPSGWLVATVRAVGQKCVEIPDEIILALLLGSAGKHLPQVETVAVEAVKERKSVIGSHALSPFLRLNRTFRESIGSNGIFRRVHSPMWEIVYKILTQPSTALVSLRSVLWTSRP